jgi:SAM-dependent methyltransferase
LEPALPREQRRAAGIYYTPPEIVRLIVELTLGPVLSSERSRAVAGPLKILDPACGAAEFLVEAYRRVAHCSGRATARDAVFGMDVNASAIEAAQQRLQRLDPDFATANLRVVNALGPKTFPPNSFSAILGNPPYINIRQLAKTFGPEHVPSLRQRFRTARGNFDLYVLFIERAIQWLKPGGRCGLILPNKWATLDYARACRELLLSEATIEQVIDLSSCRVFGGASVYPHVLVFRKDRPRQRHAMVVRQFRASAAESLDVPAYRVPQRSLSADHLLLCGALDVESRVATRPLGELATISCGTAGYAAQRIARRLVECGGRREAGGRLADFITSGNIDRYRIYHGDVRFLNQTYVLPRLPLDAPELTAAKRRLFANPKIVIAGMSRRLEAAWDDRGLALGVQVFAASDFQIDPFYLLALLNSKFLSYLFATRFAAKRLSGGYLAINKGQLVRLPIVVGTLRVPSAMERLINLARTCSLNGVTANSANDAQLDRLVYDLYRLSDAEVARVEQHIAQPLAWAA